MDPVTTPISISLADHLTPEEREQIEQTIQMFEAIAVSNPDDYQSLEILKEAHWKNGNQAEALRVSRQLADAYMRLGQYSSALMEYEGILEKEPELEEVREILTGLVEKLHSKKSGKAAEIALDFETEAAKLASASAPAAIPAAPPGNNGEDSRLIATAATTVPQQYERGGEPENDGNEPMAKFLIQHRLVSHEIINHAMETVRQHNAHPDVLEGRAVAASLLNEIGRAGADIETIISGIIDRTKYAYAPLENYDVDREIVKMLPESLTLGRLVLPFDVVSRTMMVAVDNPFDVGAKNAVMQSVDYHIQWHLALPHVIRKTLREVYRLG
ncbi:MAG TPA: hypothetical protein VNQ90_17385 [Chthoniobacteraceae bacterium]|nr:hypothetical protein [Chthoniobacteraceae bacterium]